MMRSETRALKLILVAGAALSVLYLLSFIYSPHGEERSFNRSLLAPSQIERVKELRFKGPEGNYALARGESGWRLIFPDGSSLPARSDRISSFLLSLSKKMPQTLVSLEPDQLHRLGLEGEEAIHVSIQKNEGQALTLIVGAADRSGSRLYIQNGEGTTDAYLREDNFSWFLRAGPRSWLDLRVLPSCTGADIQRLSFSGHLTLKDGAVSTNYTLRRDAKDGWNIEGKPLRVNRLEAERICSALAKLEAEDFLRDQPHILPTASVSLDLGDTRSIRLSLYPGPDQNHVTASDSGRTYLLGADEVSSFFKSLESIASEN